MFTCGLLMELFKKCMILKIVKRIYFAARKVLYFFVIRWVVVSYPKSGRTWVRFFLSMYEQYMLDTKGLDNVNLIFSSIGRNTSIFPLLTFDHRQAQTAILFSSVQKRIKRLKRKHILFLVRDPRDVIVSAYFDFINRSPLHQGEFKGITLSEFVRHEYLGVKRIVDFYNSMHAARSTFKTYRIFRYEDLKLEPKVSFKNLISYLSKEKVNLEALMYAIEQSSFQKMKHIEKNNLLKSGRLRAPDPSNENSYKVRKGKIGGYKDTLNTEDLVYIEKAILDLNPIFGYTK